MKTFSHLRQYLAKFFFEWEIFWTKVAEKIKTHILCSVTFFLKSCLLWDNFEKCGGATEARMSSQYAVYELLAKQGYMHARVCTRPRAWTRTRDDLTRAHTHTRARAQLCNTSCFFTSTMIRARASMLRYTYIACFLVFDCQNKWTAFPSWLPAYF
jgi:hypothetical protein